MEPCSEPEDELGDSDDEENMSADSKPALELFSASRACFSFTRCPML